MSYLSMFLLKIPYPKEDGSENVGEPEPGDEATTWTKEQLVEMDQKFRDALEPWW